MSKRVSEDCYSANYIVVNSLLSGKAIIEVLENDAKSRFAVITKSDVTRLISFFCKNDDSAIFDLDIRRLFTDAPFVFAEDFNGKTKVTNLFELERGFLNEEYLEVFFDRTTFLRGINWEYLIKLSECSLKRFDPISNLKILQKINELKSAEYPSCIEFIVELKFYIQGLEYNRSIKPYRVVFKDSKKTRSATEITSKRTISAPNRSRTTLGSVIERFVIAELNKGGKAKPLEVWKSISSQTLLPDPIIGIDNPRKSLRYIVPTTFETEIMPYKTFQNRVKEYKDFHSGLLGLPTKSRQR